MRYFPLPVPETQLSSFVGKELTRITAALRDIDADTILTTSLDTGTIHTTGTPSRFASQVIISADGSVTTMPSFSGGAQYFGIEGTLNTLATITKYGNDTTGALIGLRKSRGAAVGSDGQTSLNDQIGGIFFYGNDGTGFKQSAAILAYHDAATGANDLPARLSFYTTPDGSVSPLERMRIEATGLMTHYDTSGNIVAQAGDPLNGHQGFLAQRKSGQYALLYFYEQSVGVKGYVGHQTTNLEIVNSATSGQITFHTTGGAGTKKFAVLDSVGSFATYYSDGSLLSETLDNGSNGSLLLMPKSGTTNYGIVYFYTANLGALMGYVGYYDFANDLQLWNNRAQAYTSLYVVDSGAVARLAIQIRGGAASNALLGFHGTAPVAKPTVTGSRGANAALASLLTALAGYGLLVDSST